MTLVRGQDTLEVCSGLSGLKILKTTQAGFEKFVDDEYRTLPDTRDRFFCTVVDASWKYNSKELEVDICYDTVFEKVS